MIQVAINLQSGANTMPDSSTRPTMPPVNTSRYSSIVGFRFADQVLHVHQYLLVKAPKLRALVSANREVSIPDISGAVGHVIVHYLYTDTLTKPDHVSNLDELHGHFEVYAAAIKYQLVGLREAVQQAIGSQTANVEPSEALAVVKRACPLPDAADLWLHGYTKALLDAAFKDVTSFLASDLMAPEKAESTISITEMLLRAVISSVKEKEELKRIKIETLCAERDALKRKRIKKGRLGKISAAKLLSVTQELALLMAGDEPHPEAIAEAVPAEPVPADPVPADSVPADSVPEEPVPAKAMPEEPAAEAVPEVMLIPGVSESEASVDDWLQWRREARVTTANLA